MKMNHSKIMKSALPIFAFLTSISAVAKTASNQTQLQQDGPEPPPGVPIDGYIPIVLIAIVLFTGIYFFKKRNYSKTAQ